MGTSSSVTIVDGRDTPAVQVDRFTSTVTLLLTPAERASEVWRQDVVRSLRLLMEADRAVMMFWQGGTPSIYADALSDDVIQEYMGHFAALDHGMIRRDALGLTVWSRSQLWDRGALLRSAYFHEFALRHDLQDSVGLSLDIDGTPVHVRAALLYAGAPLSQEILESMLRRLGLLVPVFQTGVGMHLRYQRWLGAVPSMLDRIGEPLLLYSLAGREHHRNITLRRTLEQDPERERILDAVGAVARAVMEHARSNGRSAAAEPLPAPAASRREVQTGMGRYRVRGCLVGPDTLDAESAVLVSVDRLNPEPPTPESLRDRFGLTAREAQVACFLAQRLTNDEIASALGISSHTARHHTESVLLKLGVTSRRSLRQLLVG